MAFMTEATAIKLGVMAASIAAGEYSRRYGQAHQKKVAKAQEKENFRAQMLSMATKRNVQPSRIQKDPGAGLQFATAAGQYIPLIGQAATLANDANWFRGGGGGGGEVINPPLSSSFKYPTHSYQNPWEG